MAPTPQSKRTIEFGVFFAATLVQIVAAGYGTPAAIYFAGACQVVSVCAYIILLSKYPWHRASVRMDYVLKGSAGLSLMAVSVYVVHLTRVGTLPQSSRRIDSAVDSIFFLGIVAVAMFWIRLAGTVNISRRNARILSKICLLNVAILGALVLPWAIGRMDGGTALLGGIIALPAFNVLAALFWREGAYEPETDPKQRRVNRLFWIAAMIGYALFAYKYIKLFATGR